MKKDWGLRRIEKKQRGGIVERENISIQKRRIEREQAQDETEGILVMPIRDGETV